MFTHLHEPPMGVQNDISCDNSILHYTTEYQEIMAKTSLRATVKKIANSTLMSTMTHI